MELDRNADESNRTHGTNNKQRGGEGTHSFRTRGNAS